MEALPPEFRLRSIRADNGLKMDNWWIWDPSIIRDEKGTYHMFASRWPQHMTFHPSWMTNSEVIRATSKNLEGPYTFQEVVLPARGAEYWDGRATHNPRICKGPDAYYLFYTGITHPFPEIDPERIFKTPDPECIVSRSNKRVGVAHAQSLEGPWTLSDRPVLETKPATYYSYLTSNASPIIHDDGSVIMTFKSKRYDGHQPGPMMLGIAQAPHPCGPYKMDEQPLWCQDAEIEDPFFWKDGNGYRIIAKDMEGVLCGEHGAGVALCSQDGHHWELSENPLAYRREVTWTGGKRQKLGSFERAFLYFENTIPVALVAAVADGPGGFTCADHTWNVVIPIDKE